MSQPNQSTEIEPYEPPRRDDKKDRLDAAVTISHNLGMSQNETARELRVSRWQVRKASERLGIEWGDDRSHEAVKAAAAKARRDRVNLIVRWQDMANDQLDAAENESAADVRYQSVVMAGIATDKAINLAKLATVEPDDDGMSEGMRHITMLSGMINRSVAYMDLAKRLGATEDQLKEIERNPESVDSYEDDVEMYPDDH